MLKERSDSLNRVLRLPFHDLGDVRYGWIRPMLKIDDLQLGGCVGVLSLSDRF
jgi:hypothetical protein